MIDDRGRLFGRVNLVDAALIVVFVGLLPLAYGAYVLFRTPAPKLIAVTPQTLQHGPNLRVTIRGENFRPYMRVSFNSVQGMTFLFASTTQAEIDLPTLSPGVYDVVLYDYAQERARLPKALTITPPPLPSTEVMVVGMLANLPEATANAVAKGLKIKGYGEVLAAGRPITETTRVNVGDGTVDIPVPKSFRVPITFKMACYVQMIDYKPMCIGEGVPLRPETFILLQTALGNWPLQISQVLSPEPLEPVEAVVRFVGRAPVLQLVRPGDVDLGASMNELAAGARVVGVEAIRPGRDPAADDRATLDATLLLQGQRGANGWRYAGESLRPGGGFMLRTRKYEASGSVLRVKSTPAAAGGQ